MAMTLDQQRALAIAEARMKAAQGQNTAAQTGAELSAITQSTNQPPGVPAFDPGVPGYDPQTGEVSPQYSRGGSAAMGAADATTLGWGDEIASYLASGLSGVPRQQVLSEMRGNANAAQTQNPGSYLAGQVGGGLAQAAATGGGGFGLLAARSGGGLARVALGGAADGALYGGTYGAGSAEEGGRLAGAKSGGIAGAALGGALPLAVAGGGAAASPLLAPVLARLKPQDYANKAMQATIRRSGSSVDNIVNMLTRAQADDQGAFTIADALGHQGGRALSTVVRTPNDMRQKVVDALVQRQMGQGERLSRTLAEGFNAPDTAAQRAASLANQRSTLANVNYANARNGAGPVNLNGALSTIDDLLGRDPILGDTALSMGPMGTRLQGLRDQMQKGGEQLVDFDRVLNLKSDMYQQMQRNPDIASELRPVYNMLDSALERASPQYRAANDAFRAQSRTIDAVDLGRSAASGRARAADTIQGFQAMRPGEQNAFRAGYVDPLIAKVEASSISPTTNKARPLVTEKTGQEFPTFAVPQRADKMGRRIAREQRMFETSNAALGGSKTADNLADAAEMAKFDPSVMAKLFSGRPVAAVMDAVTKLVNEGRGMPPGVLERVGQALMTTDPKAARVVLTTAKHAMARNAARQATIAAAMRSGAIPTISGR